MTDISKELRKEAEAIALKALKEVSKDNLFSVHSFIHEWAHSHSVSKNKDDAILFCDTLEPEIIGYCEDLYDPWPGDLDFEDLTLACRCLFIAPLALHKIAESHWKDISDYKEPERREYVSTGNEWYHHGQYHKPDGPALDHGSMRKVVYGPSHTDEPPAQEIEGFSEYTRTKRWRWED